MVSLESGREQVPLDSTKIGHIYFFAHDLMLAYGALVTASPRDVVLHTLRQARVNLGKFAAGGSPFDLTLIRIIEDVDHTKDSEWTDKKMGSHAAVIFAISRQVGDALLHVQTRLSAIPPGTLQNVNVRLTKQESPNKAIQ